VDNVLLCDCGFEARAADEAKLVACVKRHAREVHGMELDDEQVLVLAFRAQLDGTPPSEAQRGLSSVRREAG
jgi:hypothetical protein